MQSTSHSFDEDSVALVPVHDASCCVRSWTDRIPAPLVFGAGVAALFAFACLIVWLPLTSFWSVGAAISGLFVLTSIPWPRRGSWAINPDAVADREVATAYGALRAAHAHLAAILAERDESSWAKTVIERSRDTIVLCGRLAWSTNPARQYLAARDPDAAVADEARLRQRAIDSADAETVRLFAAAAAARNRQIATDREIQHLRNRVLARLELATSSVDAVTAIIAKTQMIDDESLALDDVSVHVDRLNDDVDALASATTICMQ